MGEDGAAHRAQPAAVRPGEGAAVPRAVSCPRGHRGPRVRCPRRTWRRVPVSPLSATVTICCLRAPVRWEAGPWQSRLCRQGEPSPIWVPMAVAQVTPGLCAPRRAGGLRSSVGAGRLPPGASCSDALGNRVAIIAGGPGRLDEGPSSPLSASLHLPGAATRGRSCPVEAAVPTLRGLPGPGIFGAGKPALLSPCAAWRPWLEHLHRVGRPGGGRKGLGGRCVCPRSAGASVSHCRPWFSPSPR